MSDIIGGWYSDIEPIGEDCLSLNVYAPTGDTQRRRPVMVWLHGGGWSTSSGTAPGLDGTYLARDHDVVIVTVNHRLGVFGYLAFEGTDARFADSASAGVLDMVAALHWVRDNIAAFGGDSGNVTIFGQSGGAAKIVALMGMPAARGLFHKATVQSCSGGLRLMPRDQALRLTGTLAQQLGLPRADAASFQGVPMEALAAASRRMGDPFRPVLDGRTFTAHPFDGTPTPLSAHIPVLIGNAANEATQFLAPDPRNRDIDLPTMLVRLGRFWKTDATQTRDIVETYRRALPGASLFHVFAQLATDSIHRRNTMEIARLKATQPAPVHAYVFDWKTPVFGGILLSPHTCEVPFIFGTTRQAAGIVGTGPELAGLTRAISSAWAAFARTGDPSVGALANWPAYTPQGREVMVLDVASHVARDPGGALRSALAPVPLFEYGMLGALLRA